MIAIPKRLPATLACALVLIACTTALAQDPAAAHYSKMQADRGAALYAAHCTSCHGGSMEGLDVAPALVGPRFLGQWSGQSVAALSARIRTSMPLDRPGTLGLQASADITAAILAQNGYPAGADDLPGSPAQQQKLVLKALPQ